MFCVQLIVIVSRSETFSPICSVLICQSNDRRAQSKLSNVVYFFYYAHQTWIGERESEQPNFVNGNKKKEDISCQWMSSCAQIPHTKLKSKFIGIVVVVDRTQLITNDWCSPPPINDNAVVSKLPRNDQQTTKDTDIHGLTSDSDEIDLEKFEVSLYVLSNHGFHRKNQFRLRLTFDCVNSN